MTSRLHEQETHGRLLGRFEWASLAVLFMLYLVAVPSHPGPTGDNAEFQYLGKVFGIPHPTGYPLYLTLNGLFVWTIPWGTLAWRANVFSSLCMAGTFIVLLNLMRRLGAGPWSSLSAALCVCLASPLFHHAIHAEVYALNALFFVSTILACLRVDERARPSAILLLCAVYAFSFGNHLTMLLLLPGLLAWLLMTCPRMFLQPRLLLVGSAIVLLAASQYAYLLVRSGAQHSFQYTALNSVTEVIAYVTGAQFETAKGFGSIRAVLAKAWFLGRGVLADAAPLLIAAVPGVFILWRKDHRATIALLLIAVTKGLFILWYGIPDISDYLLPLFLLMALFAALGFEHTLRFVRPSWHPLLMLLPLAYAIFALCGVRWTETTRDQEVRRFLEKNHSAGILLTRNWRDSNIARYYTLGEKIGQDIHVSEFAEAHFSPEWPSQVRRWHSDGLATYAIAEPRLLAFLHHNHIPFTSLSPAIIQIDSIP